MKFIITIFIISFSSVTLAFGQSLSRLNNYWDNLYSINPASINDAYLGSVSMATRKQWTGFPGAPAFLQATGTIYFEDYYTQIGTKIFAEKKGFTTQMQFGLSYTYALLLQNQWVLNMGMSLNFQNLSYDLTEINYSEIITPDIYDKLLVNNNINADLGFELNYTNYKFGISSHNLVSTFNSSNDLHPNTNIMYAAYRDQSLNYVNVGLGLSVFQQRNLVQGEFNFNTYFNKTMDNERLQLGFIYRTWREVGFLFGVDLNKYKFIYSFDYNFSPIYRHSYGSHEIMLIYNFNRAYRCVNCGWY